ncbi:MAG: copper amine oxidase N-terminal domain-containing protein [Clostridia bacterium]|nr:copper amine oxidase N-terminal domain-containing protein [Clostridia bacterium]
MKRIVVFTLTLLVLLISVSAADDITVKINGVTVDFDTPPILIKDRTMVPMRKTFEALGATVDWVPELRMALATYKTKIISMQIDADTFTVTDVLSGESKVFALDVPAQIVNDRTLIPLRAVSEALDKDVSWDGTTKTALIKG